VNFTKAPVWNPIPTIELIVKLLLVVNPVFGVIEVMAIVLRVS